MDALLLFLSFLVFLFMGIPVAFALGLSSGVYLLATGQNLIIIPQFMYVGMDSFVLMSIPGFVLAGNLMSRGGITTNIVTLSNAFLGHIRGGLGLANVGSSMLMAGVSGTAVADVASTGAAMIPAMEKEGYDVDYACAITAASSVIGAIKPPSVPLIVAGTVTGISVSSLFVAGMIPGFTIGFGLIAMAYYLSCKRGYPQLPKASWAQRFAALKSAVWAIIMVVIILGGIIGGVFTPTEAAMVAVTYAFIIGLFVYKVLKFRDIPVILRDSVITSGSIILLVGFARVFAYILTVEQIPQMIANLILGITAHPIGILIIINLLLLFVGAFMETLSAIMILFPVLLTVSRAVGISDIQFATMATLNLVISLTTPPVGIVLFVAGGIGRISLARMVKAMLPFYIVLGLVILLVMFVPAVTTFLPALLN